MDSKTLIIDEDKAPDFYGLKGKLIESLKNPYQKKEEPKQPIEETSQKKTFFKTTWVNTSLIVVNSILFVFCFFLGGTIFDLGMLDLPSVMKDGEWYRLISSMFLHSDITHLTSNMLLLFVLGELVENELGHAKYLALYFGAGLGGDLFSLIFEYITKNYTGSIGASGAIFGVAGAFLWILIRNYGRMNNISAVQIIFLISYSLYSGFRSTNVDNAAHVGGVLTGFILCIFLYHKKQKSKNEKASVKAASE